MIASRFLAAFARRWNGVTMRFINASRRDLSMRWPSRYRLPSDSQWMAILLIGKLRSGGIISNVAVHRTSTLDCSRSARPVQMKAES